MTHDHALNDMLRNAPDADRQKLLEGLRPRERRVLELRFGMNGGNTHSLRQIGHLLRVSKERARGIQNRALEKAGVHMKEFRPLLRNWDAIANVQCDYTKAALSMSQSHGTLRRLWTAFPECFREGSPNETDLFSWKHILEYAEQAYPAHNEGRPPYKFLPYAWMQYIAKGHPHGDNRDCWPDLAGIPVFASWFNNNNEKVPEELIEQFRALRGTVLKGPIFLKYKGIRCVVGWVWFEISRTPLPNEGNVFNEDERSLEELQDLLLVPADVIRFDC